MNVMSVVLVVVALALIVAWQWGAVDAFLPGGRWNPYTAATVESGSNKLRAAAHLAMAIVVLTLIAVAAAIEWKWHAS
jgi:hypothetical protein